MRDALQSLRAACTFPHVCHDQRRLRVVDSASFEAGGITEEQLTLAPINVA